jgi:hypothetical protein
MFGRHMVVLPRQISWHATNSPDLFVQGVAVAWRLSDSPVKQQKAEGIM